MLCDQLMFGARFRCTELKLIVDRAWDLADIVSVLPSVELTYPFITMDSNRLASLFLETVVGYSISLAMFYEDGFRRSSFV